MDELATFNRERWNALVEAGVEYSRPFLDLTPEKARQNLGGMEWFGEVRGKRVLCLANGGGQQSAVFGLLGADVTVLDLSDAMLEQDRVAARRYGLTIRTEQGDMRDLSRFDVATFDIVQHDYSINFVPNPREVFAQVARVLKPHGWYVLGCSNPHRFSALEGKWHDGIGYGLMQKYVDGEVTWDQSAWEVERENGPVVKVDGPREFNHTWRTLIRGLAEKGFVIHDFKEWMRTEDGAKVGSWAHYTQVLPPFVTFVTRFMPNVLSQANE